MWLRFPRDFSDAGAGAPVDDAVREAFVTFVPFVPSASVAGGGVPGTGRSGDSKRWPALIFHPPPRTPPATKGCNDAISRMRWSRRAPERYAPATFFLPADASNRDGGSPSGAGTPRK